MSYGTEDQFNATTSLQGSRTLFLTPDGNQAVGLNSYTDASSNAIVGLILLQDINDPPNQLRTTVNNTGIEQNDASGNLTIDVSWENLKNLKLATPALRLPATNNIFVVNDTYEANDNNLAKTRRATISAVSATDPTLELEVITSGEKATLTQDTLTYLDASGGTPVSASWASIIAGGATPSLSSVLAVGNSAGTFDIDMSGNDITNATSITSTTFVGDLSGNATSATTSTNIAGGAGGSIPYQTAVNTTALLANGSSGQFLKSLGGTNPPFWDSLPVVSTPTLSQVLAEGNSAGTFDIDMSGNDITSVGNISVASPYNFSVISIFTDASGRDIALPSPYVGQFAFLSGTNTLQFYNAGWNAIGGASIPVLPTISGFSNPQYEIIYVNSSNAVVGSPSSGGFTIVRFYPTTTTSGSITLSQTVSITYLLVAGGGGGGGAISAQCNGGGGGAGGYLSSTASMTGSVSYALQVGGGGAGGSGGSGVVGTNSQLAVVSGTIIANGGGAGASNLAGGNGGSGGGGSASNISPSFNGGIGSQGQNGGQGVLAGNAYSGGGGGATSVGAGGGVRGDGGAGTANTITGVSITYAGGGGGGSNGTSADPSLGGSGGGGNGGAGIPSSTYTIATAGTNGLGGGGGGGGQGASANVGFKGGAGVVIVRFASFI